MFEINVEAKFGDLDGLKHINNNKINEWFELAQNHIFKIFNPELNLDDDKWNLRLIHNESQFINQTYYNNSVKIKLYIEEIGKDYFTTYAEAWQENRLTAIEKSTFQHYNWIKQEQIPISDNVKKELKKHLKD